jgi:aspartate-semialdehyde dehydrogenase
MTNKAYRIAIVGASSLAGKELSDALGESPLAAASFALLDEDNATGQVAAAGDEVSFIQKIDGDSFKGMDFVFLAGEQALAAKYGLDARRSGAGIVDLTAALAGYAGVLVRAPWVAAAMLKAGGKPNAGLNLETSAVVPAHPASVMLALIAARLVAKFSLASFHATVLEPASQYGRAAMDELHQQTVSLLSFQSLPREQYDAQVAFNLLPALGEAAKIKLNESADRIADNFATLTAGVAGAMPEMGLQLVHAPVFHGYTASVFIEIAKPATVEEVEISLVGDHIDIVAAGSEPPSNLSAAGQEEIMVRVETAPKNDGPAARFKLWVAADNLKLAAANAIACAMELAALRPLGKVQ